MPLNPFENVPALLGRHTVGVDKYFENFNDLRISEQAREYIKLSPGDDLDNSDGPYPLSSLGDPASLMKPKKA